MSQFKRKSTTALFSGQVGYKLKYKIFEYFFITEIPWHTWNLPFDICWQDIGKWHAIPKWSILHLALLERNELDSQQWTLVPFVRLQKNMIVEYKLYYIIYIIIGVLRSILIYLAPSLHRLFCQTQCKECAKYVNVHPATSLISYTGYIIKPI